MMKQNLQIIIVCFLILISYTAKSQTIPGYINNDALKLQAFLDLPNGGSTNGLKLNGSYDRLNPLTWTGVTWDGASPYQSVVDINFISKNLTGSLDCSGFTALTGLDCSTNQISALDVTGDAALISLVCRENLISTLDVSGNTMLGTLYCNDNQLTTLNVLNNTALTKLYCYNNNLNTLNVTKNTALTNLNCTNNHLSVLDVTQNTSLINLYCRDNQLSVLDVTQNKSLSILFCTNNQLPSLDVTQNTALTELYCDSNQLPSLDVAFNKSLIKLFCGTNQLTALDVTNNTALTGLFCDSNQISTLDISQNKSLITFDCNNNLLKALDISQNAALTDFFCYNNQISVLDVTNNTGLLTLKCYNNKLTALDISKNLALTSLNCSSNELKFSDLEHSATITTLYNSPQNPFIPSGTDTIGGTIAAATGSTIHLSTEAFINSVVGASNVNTTFKVWKKAWDGTITDVTSLCGNVASGEIILPPTAGENDSLFITLDNTSYPNFIAQTAPITPVATTMRTRTFALVGASFLPIELLSFTANLNNNKVDLAWSTASEKNNYFFTVERSINNKDWGNVAKVDGAGNSNTQLNYSTIDENPLSGVSYYRLKQTDFDGKFEYSKTVVIDRNAKTTIQLYPNPANNQISVTGNEDDLNSIKIYNSLGQDVTKYTNYSASNTKQKQIDISKLTTGIYIIKTKNTTNRLIVK